ncbi:hypothetical protein QFZ94_007452 [Paraburkholderia sp. JPY465]|uniref:hypothetical protein n=1 Tax=Paraburkholderia sp. JPY465 TaxID=3042285 RepID=UPI003D239B72
METEADDKCDRESALLWQILRPEVIMCYQKPVQLLQNLLEATPLVPNDRGFAAMVDFGHFCAYTGCSEECSGHSHSHRQARRYRCKNDRLGRVSMIRPIEASDLMLGTSSRRLISLSVVRRLPMSAAA